MSIQEPMKVILLEIEFFSYNQVQRKSYWLGAGKSSTTGVIIRKEKRDLRRVEVQGRSHVKTEADNQVRQLQAKEFQEPPGAKERQGKTLSWSLPREHERAAP